MKKSNKTMKNIFMFSIYLAQHTTHYKKIKNKSWYVINHIRIQIDLYLGLCDAMKWKCMVFQNLFSFCVLFFVFSCFFLWYVSVRLIMIFVLYLYCCVVKIAFCSTLYQAVTYNLWISHIIIAIAYHSVIYNWLL